MEEQKEKCNKEIEIVIAQAEKLSERDKTLDKREETVNYEKLELKVKEKELERKVKEQFLTKKLNNKKVKENG